MYPTWIFVYFVLLYFAVNWLLNWVNIRHSLKSADNYTDVFDKDIVEKTKNYSLDKHQLESTEMAVLLLVSLGILIFPVLPSFYNITTSWTENKLWNEAFFVFLVSGILSTILLPLNIWNTFKIEAKYGFNKMSVKLWVSDKIKGLIISLIILLPLLVLLLYVVEKLGAYWWVIGALIVIAFQFLMLLLYPMLIMPLFNKFSPLPDGDLKKKLFALSQKTSFPAGDIEVMDGSRRSGHSNAFFTGFGKFRKIVLFDTLVEQLNQEEVVSVLAHEIGHYKKGHIPKRLIFSCLMVFAVFGLIDWLMNQSWLSQIFGLPTFSFASTIVLFSLYGNLISFWFSPITNWRSRKDEYEADAYAKKIVGTSKFLVDALKKLTQKNLSNFEPHPLYSFVHYSHPTLKEREKALIKDGN